MADNLTTTPPANVAELLERLGDLPAERVRMQPPPGTATEDDVLRAAKGPDGRLCELVEGALVEKVVGTREALLGGLIVHLLWDYLEENDLGQAFPADGYMRLMPGLVRVPDVAFVSWDQLPAGELPDEAIASIYPDLAVEVLSQKNTKGEIARKLRDYFLAGTRLAWVIDPRKQTARAYTAPDESTPVGKAGTLEGGDVLPGFRISLPRLFARTRRNRPKK